MYALQAQKQRRLMREEGMIERALQAKLKLNQGQKAKKKRTHWNFENGQSSNKGSKAGDEKADYPPCQH